METSCQEIIASRVAGLIAAEVASNPSICLGLPTGRTPAKMYAELVKLSRQNNLDWSRVCGFALDEYLDVDETQSFSHYLSVNLYDGVGLPAANRFNPSESGDDYDALIAARGGLDITILGIGLNGHIAFNEPGTPAESWTHSIVLTPSTIDANRELFKGAGRIPTRAVTMGISTILGSRRIILMAFGEKKRSILDQALTGPISPEIPASFLQQHDSLQVFTDFERAQACRLD
ncbi:MAG: glucosamine-6-phosphate deaminase [Candidatus Obscuribacterales bacterium]